jgi:LacI family transcriptional regulator
VPVAPHTRERIKAAAKQLGFIRSGLAVALSTGRTHTIGLVFETDLSRPAQEGMSYYAKDVLAAMTKVCAEAGLRLTAILQPTDGALDVRDVVDGRVDGLVLLSQRSDEFARAVFESSVPTVSIGTGFSNLRVSIDNEGAMEAAIEHLVSLGHRDIVFVRNVKPQGGITEAERIAGYSVALSKRGLDSSVIGLAEFEQIAKLSTRPTAFVCFNDETAWRLISLANSSGMRVPKDLSVVGFDNSLVASHCIPPITSVNNPLEAQAKVAVDLLQAIWRGESPVEPDRIPTKLVVRASTGPCPIHS